MPSILILFQEKLTPWSFLVAIGTLNHFNLPSVVCRSHATLRIGHLWVLFSSFFSRITASQNEGQGFSALHGVVRLQLTSTLFYITTKTVSTDNRSTQQKFKLNMLFIHFQAMDTWLWRVVNNRPGSTWHKQRISTRNRWRQIASYDNIHWIWRPES